VIHYRNTTFLTQAMSKMSFPLLHQAIIESNVNKVITNCLGVAIYLFPLKAQSQPWLYSHGPSHAGCHLPFPNYIDWITIHWTSPSPP